MGQLRSWVNGNKKDKNNPIPIPTKLKGRKENDN